MNNVDNSKKLKHLSLCTGYGGIDLGLKRALGAIEPVAYVEIEAFAVANLVAKIEKEFIDPAPIWTNLKTLDWSLFRGRVDILSGGFPCQPFSSAGSRKGDQDEQHLFPFIKRGIEICRPAIVFLENVEGIVSSKLSGDSWSDPEGTPVLLHVLRELERIDYTATFGIFSASEIGAPHQRKRVFILGIQNELGQNGINEINGLLRPTSRSYGSALGNAESELYQIGEQGEMGEAVQEIWAKVIDALGTSNRDPRVAYPAGRGREQYWYEPPRVTRETESAMGGNVNGDSDWLDLSKLYQSCDNRTDELRLLGNGVVPDTAERAFRELWKELFKLSDCQ